MNNHKIKILEILSIIIISFSPLIPNSIKIFIIIILIILNLKSMEYIEKRNGILLSIIMILFLVGGLIDLSNISNLGNFSVLNFYFPLCFFVGFLISKKYNFHEYLSIIDKIVFLIAIFSLIGVLIYSFLPQLVSYLPNYRYYHTTHKTAYFFNILIPDGNILQRNAGIAWEPGAFQFLVNLGMYAYLTVSKKINILKITIYGLTVLTTSSTAGIFIFIFITFKVLFKDKKLWFLILIFIFAFFDNIIDFLNYQSTYKLFGSYSFEKRLEPLLNVLEFSRNYFWGLGNFGYDRIYLQYNLGAYDSFGQIIIRYGYPLLTTIIIILLFVAKNFSILFVIITITFFSQGIWYLPIVTSLYFMKRNNKIGSL